MPAVRMFIRMQTQWNIGGLGVPLGLNYTALESLFRIYGTKRPRRLLDSIRVMELAALKVMHARERKG